MLVAVGFSVFVGEAVGLAVGVWAGSNVAGTSAAGVGS